MKRTAVLVTASRKWRNKRIMYERLKRYPKGTILIHGGAIGGDTIADEIGRKLGFDVHVYRYFGDLEKAGGHARNRCMVDVLLVLMRHGFDCYLEGFPIGISSGTRGCIELVDRHNDRAIAAKSHMSCIAKNVIEG